MDCDLLCLVCHVQIACFHMHHILPRSIVLYIYTVQSYSNDSITLILNYSYGLAPGRPFPAGHEDSIAVTKHVMENLEHYGIVSNRIFTAGKSITFSCCCAFKVCSGISLQPQPNTQPVSSRGLCMFLVPIHWLKIEGPKCYT